MLGEEDKRWLEKVLDQRFNAQDVKIEERFAAQDEKSERQNASLRQELNRVMDQKAAVFRRGMREEIERSEERIIRHFDIIYENRILPMIEEHIAVLPGEGQSYELLEERVRKVEDDISVMKVAMAARV